MIIKLNLITFRFVKTLKKGFANLLLSINLFKSGEKSGKLLDKSVKFKYTITIELLLVRNGSL